MIIRAIADTAMKTPPNPIEGLRNPEEIEPMVNPKAKKKALIPVPTPRISVGKSSIATILRATDNPQKKALKIMTLMKTSV